MFSFAHIEHLILLILLVPLAIFFSTNRRWKKKVRARMGDAELIQLLTAGHSSQKYSFKFWLLAGALLLIVLGAANLRQSGAGEQVNRKGRDVIIALDVSKSMLADDIKPNRLDKARQFTGKVLNLLPDDRIGLIWFAGKAYLPMPLTADDGAARLFLQSASPETVPTQGTVIAEALRLAAQSFPAESKRYKIVILITDGEDHDEQAIEAARDLKEQGILLLVIGLGTIEGSPITEPGTTDFKKDQQGQTVVSKLNEPLLKQMAKENGGMYGNLQHTDAMVNDVAAVISQLDKKGISEAGSTTSFSNFFQWFLALAVLLLATDVFITDREKHKRSV